MAVVSRHHLTVHQNAAPPPDLAPISNARMSSRGSGDNSSRSIAPPTKATVNYHLTYQMWSKRSSTSTFPSKNSSSHHLGSAVPASSTTRVRRWTPYQRTSGMMTKIDNLKGGPSCFCAHGRRDLSKRRQGDQNHQRADLQRRHIVGKGDTTSREIADTAG